MRQEYIEQKRRWELDQAVSAPEAQPEEAYSIEEQKGTNYATAVGGDDTREEAHMLDEIMSQEDDALNALIAQAPRPRTASNENSSIGSGAAESEDEDYQSLFADLITIEHHLKIQVGDRPSQEQLESQCMDVCPI